MMIIVMLCNQSIELLMCCLVESQSGSINLLTKIFVYKNK